MKTAWRLHVLVAALLLASVGAQAALPPAVASDPARDPKYPAHNEALLIPSGGASMNTVLMQASGAAPKPTLLLLHGLPGNEQNLDLAQAIRRAGWNVLTMHYRGSWGSAGRFSIAGAVEDAEAAMTYLRRPDIAAKYRIDTSRLAIGGHSMGGFAAAQYAASHPEVAGLVLLDAWNIGAAGKALRAKPETREAAVLGIAEDLGTSLSGATADSLVDEVLRHADDWDLISLAPALAATPTLIVGAVAGGGERNKALAAAIVKNKGKVSSFTLDSDHAFADHRLALSGIVVDWLQQRAPAPQVHAAK